MFFFYIEVYVFVLLGYVNRVGVCACRDTCVKVKGQLTQSVSLLPPHGVQGSNWGQLSLVTGYFTHCTILLCVCVHVSVCVHVGA